MQVLLLYATVVLIWGSTWVAIPFQLGTVAEEVSVGYRFGLAAVALYTYAFASRRPLRLPAAACPLVFLQGALLFCINYFFVYYGTAHLTSGVVAVLFSSILILNAIFERLFFSRMIDARFWLAAAIGISGIALIFSTEISELSFDDRSVHGAMLVLCGTLIASLGNMAAVANTKRGLPVVAVNAHAMAFAAMLALIIAAVLGRDFGQLDDLLQRHDPDLLLSMWGDTWLLPHLLEISKDWGISLPLNRETDREVLHRPERTYFTYGQVVHRGRQVHLFGRWHVDGHNAMLFHDYGMHGIYELSRVTSLPVQTVARVSPGSGISAMQMLTALRLGILVPWHKQQAERPKSLSDLMRADQGGLVYQPTIGLHYDVAEIDFISL